MSPRSLARAVVRRKLVALLAASVSTLGALGATGTFAAFTPADGVLAPSVMYVPVGGGAAATAGVRPCVPATTVASGAVEVQPNQSCGIKAVVDQTTALFTVDVHVFLDGVNCSDTTRYWATNTADGLGVSQATDGVELHWRIAVGGNSKTGKTPVCRTGVTGPVDEIVIRVPMFGNALTSPFPQFSPNQVFTSRMTLRYQSAGQEDPAAPQSVFGLRPSARLYTMTTPLRPVWVGVGDGYTSSVNQTTTLKCPMTGPCAGYDANSSGTSWIQTAVTAVNGGAQTSVPVPSNWQIQPLVVAGSTTRAADLLDAGQTSLSTSATPSLNYVARCSSVLNSDVAGTNADFAGINATLPVGQQVACMRAALAARSGIGARPGSWNWIGMTAGLVDSGVPAALQTWYGSDTNTNAPLGSRSPWDAGAYVGAPTPVTTCPSYSAMDSSTSGNVTAGLMNVVAKAALADPNVRVVHPLYPYWAEADGANIYPGGAYNNPCRAGVKATVDALDGAAALLGRPGADAVREVDLRTTFGNAPTGRNVGALRDGTLIQLAKPYGFPYLSANGRSALASAVNGIIVPEPPYIIGFTARLPDVPADEPNTSVGWFRAPVDVKFTGVNGQTGEVVPLPGQTKTVDKEGRSHVESGDFCVANPTAGQPPLCAPHAFVDVYADFTAPLVVPTVSGSSKNGWYNGSTGNPVVSWAFTKDAAGNDIDPISVTNGNGFDEVTSGVEPTTGVYGPIEITASTTSQSLVNPTGTFCDKALNCAQWPVVLKADLIAPTISHTITPGTPTGLNSWYTGATAPTVNWSVADLGGSDIDASIPVGTYTPATEGNFTVPAKTVYDVAGNTASDVAFPLKWDKTPPTAGITVNGGVVVAAGGSYNIAAGGAPQPSCGDSGSGIASCTLTSLGETPDILGILRSYSVVATDNAGLSTTTTITFVALAGSNTTPEPPTVTGVAKTQPNAAGWYKSQPVYIKWTPVKGTNALGLAYLLGLPDGKAIVDGADVQVRSPKVCDINNLCSPEGAVIKHLKIDTVAPVIGSFPGITNGGVYYPTNAPDQPAADCLPITTDALSGKQDCDVVVTSDDLPSGGLSGHAFTATARATDVAGNVTTKVVTWTVFDVVGSTTGRMTGGGSYNAGGSTGTVTTDFTLRCNGSPNKLSVQWKGGSFDLGQVTQAICWDDPNVDPQQPRTPIDSYYGTGTGLYCRGGDFVGHSSNRYDDDSRGVSGSSYDDSSDHRSGGSQYSRYGDSDHSGDRWGSRSVSAATSSEGSSHSSSEHGPYYGDHDQSQYEHSNHSSSNHDADGNRCDAHNGDDGHDSHGSSNDCVTATIEWTFVDKGEPGTNDTLRIVIKDNTGKVVLDTSGKISKGNFQAHEAQGNGTNDNGNLNGPNGNSGGGSTGGSGGSSGGGVGSASTPVGMSGAGKVSGSSTSGLVGTDLSLGCAQGGAADLSVVWKGGQFDLDQISELVCSNVPNKGPSTFDMVTMKGTGLLCRSGTFEGHQSYATSRSHSERGHGSYGGQSWSAATWSGGGGNSSNSDRDGNDCRNNQTGSSSTCVAAKIEATFIDGGTSGDSLDIKITDGTGKVLLEVHGVLIGGSLTALST